MTILNELEEGGISFITDCTEEDRAFRLLGKTLNTFDIHLEGLDSFLKWIKYGLTNEAIHLQGNMDIEFESKDDLYSLFAIDSLVCRYFGSLVMIEPSLYVTSGETTHSYIVTLSKEILNNGIDILKKYGFIQDEMELVSILMGYYDFFKKYVKYYITKVITRSNPRVVEDNVISITNLVNTTGMNNNITTPSSYGLLLDMERNRILIYLVDVNYVQFMNTLDGELRMRIRRVCNEQP